MNRKSLLIVSAFLVLVAATPTFAGPGIHLGASIDPDDFLIGVRFKSHPIEEYRNFFVNGMVEKPGGYPFSPGLTVRKAISLAGGFKERASREKLNIIRDDDPTQTPRRVNLNAAILPGDILTVEESFF